MASMAHLKLAPTTSIAAPAPGLGLTFSFRRMVSGNVRISEASRSAPASLVRCTATVPASVSSKITTTKEGRGLNCAAGPATLPANVVKQVQAELFNWSGMSIIEVSHRGKEFLSLIQKAETDLRVLLKIPDEYERARRPGVRPAASKQEYNTPQQSETIPVWLWICLGLYRVVKDSLQFLWEQPGQLKDIEWPAFQSTIRMALLTVVVVGLLIISLATIDSTFSYVLASILRRVP